MFEVEPMNIDGQNDSTEVTVSLPNGVTRKRSFYLDEPVQKLRDFVDYLLLCTEMTEDPGLFEMIMSSYPHNALTNMNQTLKQANLFSKISITVRQLL